MRDNLKVAISIIIPVFNASKYLEDCLNSALNQTFVNFEVICVNDGSTDDSLEILEKYARKDHRIKIINQKNSGVISSRNNAIKLAQGKYIYPLDSDDKITPNCLEELLRIIINEDCAVVTSEVELFGKKKGKLNLQEITNVNMYSYLNCIVNSSLYEKKYWQNYGGYDEKFKNGLEDFDFYLNFLDDNQKIYRVPKILFFYRQKKSEESRNSNAASFKDLYKLLRKKHPRIWIYWVISFFYKSRTTKSGRKIIKILKIPIWLRRPIKLD
jgi:glycosyltransferase involved in cell wall biosynthesis